MSTPRESTELRGNNHDDIQIAAQALESLRTSSAAASAATSTEPSPATSPRPSASTTSSSSSPSFFNRVSSSALRAYNSGKSYSPRFRYSAEKIESVAGSFRRRTFAPTVDPDATTPTSRHYAHPHHHHYHYRRNSGATAPTTIPGAVNKKKSRPAWQSVLVTATSLASLSNESRQRLRYFLRLLKLANTKVATTVGQLQDVIQREKAKSMAKSIASNHVPHDDEQQQQPKNSKTTVNDLKQELITTIRKVVTVISTFAGNTLPEPARSHVRSYVLRLPTNWARSVENSQCATPTTAGYLTPKEDDPAPSLDSVLPQKSASTAASESSDETMVEQQQPPREEQEMSQEDIEAGGRVLSLAKESLDMLGNIIGIVDATLERADSWVGAKKQSGSGEPSPSPSSSSTTESAQPMQVDS